MAQASNKSSVRVFARFRPTRAGYEPLQSLHIDNELDQIKLGSTKSREDHRFRFDGVLEHDSSQLGAYNLIGKQAVAEVLNGFNSTVVAYGQTGSGKTHTMYGTNDDPGACTPSQCLNQNPSPKA